MKLVFNFLFLLIFLISCQSDKPKNLLDKEKMAEIIVDMAIYDQSFMVNPKINPEDASRFVLQKHSITAQDFKENYAYYLQSPSDLDDIFEKAQKKIEKMKSK